MDHQACSSSHDSQFHCNHPKTESTPLPTQPSLSSIPSLKSQKIPYHSHPRAFRCHCLTTLRCHTSYISSLTVAGNFLLIGSSNNEIRLWKHNASSELNHENLTDNVVAAGKGAVKSLVVLDDRLFSAHQDHKIRVWKVDNHDNLTQLATLPTLADRLLKFLTPKNHVQVRRHKRCTWVHHVDTISALALSKDNCLLYSVSWDRTLKIWRTTDFKCLESIENAHSDAINTIALSDDGHIYTGSADKKIKVWRQSSRGKKHCLVATLEKHKSGVNALALNMDRSVLYSGAGDRSIVVWEKGDGGNMMAVGTLRGHTKSILCLVAISDMLCSGSADDTVRIWRGVEKCYHCLAVLEGHSGPVKYLTALIDHSNASNATPSYLLYSGSLDCDIKVWQIFVPLA